MNRLWLSGFANHIGRRAGSSNIIYAVGTAVWLIVVALGLGLLTIYANRPGDHGEPLGAWPRDSAIARSETKFTLVVFAHPKCPCTRATLSELSWILSRCRSQVDCHLYFFQPDGAGPDWTTTSQWRQAELIRGVTLHRDPESLWARRFGVHTSGHVLLYDKQGRLKFEGGITPARGHTGDNRGRTALWSCINLPPPEGRRAEDSALGVDSNCVFGCPLHTGDATVLLPTTGEVGA